MGRRIEVIGLGKWRNLLAYSDIRIYPIAYGQVNEDELQRDCPVARIYGESG
jgi:hypothetical protein